MPLAISAALGLYVAVKVVALGVNVPPVLELHVADVALTLVKLPFRVMACVLHTVKSAPAFTVAAWLIVRTTVSVAGPHGPVPSASLLVYVKVIVPVSPTPGVYVAFGKLLLKAPEPPDQVPDVALPPKLPVMVTMSLLQMV